MDNTTQNLPLGNKGGAEGAAGAVLARWSALPRTPWSIIISPPVYTLHCKLVACNFHRVMKQVV